MFYCTFFWYYFFVHLTLSAIAYKSIEIPHHVWYWFQLNSRWVRNRYNNTDTLSCDKYDVSEFLARKLNTISTNGDQHTRAHISIHWLLWHIFQLRKSCSASVDAMHVCLIPNTPTQQQRWKWTKYFLCKDSMPLLQTRLNCKISCDVWEFLSEQSNNEHCTDGV